MADFNVDASILRSSYVAECKEDMIQLENGCICCTLRGDLIQALTDLSKTGKYDYCIIESTGISEPMQVNLWLGAS